MAKSITLEKTTNHQSKPEVRTTNKVIIIGTGPAGSSTAYFLAANGIDCLLIDKDKWPRDKICGGGLTTNCLPILQRMGVLSELENIIHYKFSGYALYSNDGISVSSHVRQRDGKKSKSVPYSFVIRRDLFDQLLLEQAPT